MKTIIATSAENKGQNWKNWTDKQLIAGINGQWTR